MDDRRKESFFAVRYVRLLAHANVAQELGPDVCWLLAVLANQEDEIRYSRAVTFYNQQLLQACGFKSVDRLNRVRSKAVSAGWLRYEPGGKGRAGKYLTTVPADYEEEFPVAKSEERIKRTQGPLQEHDEEFPVAKHDRKPIESRRQADRKPIASAELSDLDLRPNPPPPPQSVAEGEGEGKNFVTDDSPDRGREIRFPGLPSLRTVHAILPHTALQLVVDGLSETEVGLAQTIEPRFRKVRIGPALLTG